tara:strand:+ start:1206 stop:1436 length:231 start_codon:yes stop_codon:yes gene_type:complete
MEPINLVPITKISVSKDRWITTKIKYEDELTVKDVLEDMTTKSYEWINHKSDLDHVQDYDSFKNEFINFLYDKYYR